MKKTQTKRPSCGRNKGKGKESNDLGAVDVNEDAAVEEVEENMANEEDGTALNATDGEVARMRGE
jgi:hypothetical protein